MIFYGGFGACIGRRVRFVRRPVVAGLIIGGVSEVNGRSGPGAARRGASSDCLAFIRCVVVSRSLPARRAPALVPRLIASPNKRGSQTPPPVLLHVGLL